MKHFHFYETFVNTIGYEECLVRTVPKFNGHLTSSWRFTTLFLVWPQHGTHPFIFSLSSACPHYYFTTVVLISTIFSCSHHAHAVLKACCQCGVIYDHKCKKEGYKGVNMCDVLQLSHCPANDSGGVVSTTVFWLVASAPYCHEVPMQWHSRKLGNIKKRQNQRAL